MVVESSYWCLQFDGNLVFYCFHIDVWKVPTQSATNPLNLWPSVAITENQTTSLKSSPTPLSLALETIDSLLSKVKIGRTFVNHRWYAMQHNHRWCSPLMQDIYTRGLPRVLARVRESKHQTKIYNWQSTILQELVLIPTGILNGKLQCSSLEQISHFVKARQCVG